MLFAFILFDIDVLFTSLLDFELLSFKFGVDFSELLDVVSPLFSETSLVFSELFFSLELESLLFSLEELVSSLLSLFEVLFVLLSACFSDVDVSDFDVSEVDVSDLATSFSEVEVVLVDALELDVSLLDVLSVEFLSLVLSTELLLVDSVDSEVSDLVISVEF
ncbi:hypothetical protein [Staphylococcus haemolyticus]|uniref:hypothetical protein n=1 Tax=Staphylococcus haemolyticus TaxID=1283 RepID=UPI001F542C63|nr:hypothetical protein [Staphylococcus haemolyticus]